MQTFGASRSLWSLIHKNCLLGGLAPFCTLGTVGSAGLGDPGTDFQRLRIDLGTIICTSMLAYIDVAFLILCSSVVSSAVFMSMFVFLYCFLSMGPTTYRKTKGLGNTSKHVRKQTMETTQATRAGFLWSLHRNINCFKELSQCAASRTRHRAFSSRTFLFLCFVQASLSRSAASNSFKNERFCSRLSGFRDVKMH